MNVTSLTACNGMYERVYRTKTVVGVAVCILALFSTYLSIGTNIFLAGFSLYLLGKISMDGEVTPLESIMAVTYSLIIIMLITLTVYEAGSVTTSPLLSIPDIHDINHLVTKAAAFLFLMNTNILMSDKADWDNASSNDYFVDINTRLLNLHLSFTKIMTVALMFGIAASFSGYSDLVLTVLSPILILSYFYTVSLYLLNGKMGIESRYMACLLAIVGLVLIGTVFMHVESSRAICHPPSGINTVTFGRFIDVISLFIYAMFNSYVCLIFSALFPNANVFISVGQTPVKGRNTNEWNYF